MNGTNARHVATAVFACIAMAGCRDGVAPYISDELESDDPNLVQLTYSHQRDFNPAWSINGDTVFYSTAKFVDQPAISTTLLRIARSGGVATLLAPNAQRDTFTHIAAPVPSPTRDRIAYIHFPFIRPAAFCGVNAGSCEFTQPLFENGFIRVRSVSATVPVGFDMSIPVAFAGRSAGTTVGGIMTYNHELYPFQRAFAQMGEFLMRPTWSPAADRIAFSDGLSLRLWNLAETGATVIPNTADGVSPAWSPAGDVIAFTRLTRTDSTRITCRCQAPGELLIPTPIHNRWLYTVGRSVITLVDPAGATAVEVVEGEDPAWSPDGSFIYYSANNQIYRIPRNGGVPVAVPGTEAGRWPAVSPDGQWLAFARISDDFRNSNIWITRLGAQ